MYTDRERKKVILSYTLPKDVHSTLSLLDYYGNTVETLFDGTSKSNEIRATIDIEKYDVANKVYLYSLTVEGQTHRGPVHDY